MPTLLLLPAAALAGLLPAAAGAGGCTAHGSFRGMVRDVASSSGGAARSGMHQEAVRARRGHQGCAKQKWGMGMNRRGNCLTLTVWSSNVTGGSTVPAGGAAMTPGNGESARGGGEGNLLGS